MGSPYNNFDMLRKPLDNMDHQFLRSVECQIIHQNPSSSSPSSSSSSTPVFNTLALSNRNVEEIWNDNVRCSAGMSNSSDMGTLEEFVMRQNPLTSGVKEQDHGFIMPKMDPDMGSRWHRQEMMTMPLEPMLVESKFSVVEKNGIQSNMMDIGYLDEELKTSAPLAVAAEKSPESQGKVDTKGNFKDERMVKSTIERRRRRMIKNRESAARSRAKKQAHTNQLEESKSQLQATNDLLKKRKEVLLLLNSNSTAEPRYVLRRTSSSPF